MMESHDRQRCPAWHIMNERIMMFDEVAVWRASILYLLLIYKNKTHSLLKRRFMLRNNKKKAML